MIHFLILAGLMVCTLAANSFQCSFQMRQATMTEGGFVNGVLKYDYDRKQMSITYLTSGSIELLDWSSLNNDKPNRFRWGTGCPCAISPLTETQAVLTGPNTPAPTSIITTATYDGASFPLTASFKDGRNFQFSGCVAKSFGGDVETKPSTCSCGMPMDIVLVLDRSSSISMASFDQEKKFTQNLANAFDISATGINMGITNFHSLTWDGPVTLLQGNTKQAVVNGANALNCAGTTQCIENGSYNRAVSCCGKGTSISAGIVNGIQMLATGSTTGIRANAPKVLVVLTDGLHNSPIQKNPNGDYAIWPATQKVYGKELGSCSDDNKNNGGGCSGTLLADLDAAVAYAVKLVPSVTIYSIGVGNVDDTQLLHIAQMRPGNTYRTDAWEGLTEIFQKLVKLVCQSNSENNDRCNGCCGVCTCNNCVPPDGCDNQNKCTTTKPVGACCKQTPKDPIICQGDDKCLTYSCDPAANNGKGDCTSVPIPITPDNACAKYDCDPKTGKTLFTDLCPPEPVCRTDAKCNDNNACTTDKCVIPNPADIYSAYCQVTPISCDGGNKCETYSCDPQSGCKSTVNPLPPMKACETNTCDPKTGLITTTVVCPINCVTAQDCDDKNLCTDEECALATPGDKYSAFCRRTPKPSTFCQGADLCYTYKCDPQQGCLSEKKPVPASTECTTYSCDPKTGLTSFKDLCPPKPKCLVNTDCNDNNVCTSDVCVLPNPADPNSAYCQVTPTPEMCDQGDKCKTYTCDPVSGCKSYTNDLPAPTACESYYCDSKTGLVNKNSTCPINCVTDADCDDNNLCTDESCILTVPGDKYSAKCNRTTKSPSFCQGTDPCSNYRCDPVKGCLSEKNFIPADTNCTAYSCDPKDGSTVSKAINDDQCLPPPVCVADTDCNDNNACTDDKCVRTDPNDKRSARCEWTELPADHCDDKNACTHDECVPVTGCKNTIFAGEGAPMDICDDNNKCTLDVCDPLSLNATYPCNNTIIPCNKTDFCHEIKCHPTQGCVITDKSCPVTDNCTVSGCNVTEGCYIDYDLNCSPPVAVVAGLAAGVIAGIVVAAVAGALAVGGGSAYAFTQGAGNGLGASVANNPIYQPVGSQGTNPLHKV